MKTYTIKYETYSGDCRVETVTAYDERSAISQLVNCRIVYLVQQDIPNDISKIVNNKFFEML